MSKFKVGDKVITPFGIGTFIEELEDLGWGFSVVQFGNSKGSHYDFELLIRNKDLKLYKTPQEKLLELGWERIKFSDVIQYDKFDDVIQYEKFNEKSRRTMIIRIPKDSEGYYVDIINTVIDLELSKILTQYLEELESEKNE